MQFPVYNVVDFHSVFTQTIFRYLNESYFEFFWWILVLPRVILCRRGTRCWDLSVCLSFCLSHFVTCVERLNRSWGSQRLLVAQD